MSLQTARISLRDSIDCMTEKRAEPRASRKFPPALGGHSIQYMNQSAIGWYPTVGNSISGVVSSPGGRSIKEPMEPNFDESVKKMLRFSCVGCQVRLGFSRARTRERWRERR